MKRYISLDTAIQQVYNLEWRVQKDGKKSRKHALTFAEYYGLNSNLNDLSTEDVRLYKTYLRDQLNYSKASINRKLASISKIVTYCRGLTGFVFKHGLPLIEYERENNQRKFVFTSELLTELQETTKLMGYGYLCGLWTTLVETGCRLSEILMLEWTDIEPEFITIIDTKNGEDRVVPIFDEVKHILDERKRQGLARPFPYRVAHTQYVWGLVKKEMGMSNEKGFVIHALRHTSITRMLSQRIGIEVVQRIVGHRDIRMTQRYNHPTKEQLRFALKQGRKNKNG